MKARTLYGAVIAFSLGLFVRSYIDIEPVLAIWGGVVAFAIALAASRSEVRHAFLSTLVLSLFSFCFGILWLTAAEGRLETHALYDYVGEEVVLTGVVVREPDIRETHTQLHIETSGTRVLAFVDRYQEIAYGDRVEVRGLLEEPTEFTTDLARTFNYPGYLKARGVTHLIRFGNVSVLESGEGSPLLASLFSVKQAFMDSLERVLPSPQSGLGEGLLLGVDRGLGDEIEQAFRTTGIIHIVVLSGYNVMIVAEGVMRLLAFILTVRARVVVGCVVISLFALLVGMGPTVVRASIMAILVLIARATGRTYAIMRALMIAGTAMLLINPYLLAFDPGFQLSFLATLGLILVAPHVEKALHLVPTTLQIREFVTATLSTQLFVLPLLLFSIGELSVVAVVVNVLVLPAVAFAMLFSFVAGVVGIASLALGTFAALPAHFLLSYILMVPQWFAELPFSSFVVPQFPFWLLVLLYVLMGYGIYRLNVRAHGVTSIKKDEHAHSRFDDDTDIDLSSWTIEEEDVVRARLIKEKAHHKDV